MRINKADILLAVIIAVVGVAASIYIGFYNNDIEYGQVIVHKDNKIYGTYSLDEDREINIDENGHINKITIKDGNVQMSFANCYNQDCVKQGSIKDMSKSIVCLPHKVVVEVESKESGFDSVSR
ncbi:MAG: NusG domain II-containing protein [Eubacterium sp.]|jgi:hypothetical protein|nr:NusG domain II-containing protein [Eubacterium sp.]